MRATLPHYSSFPCVPHFPIIHLSHACHTSPLFIFPMRATLPHSLLPYYSVHNRNTAGANYVNFPPICHFLPLIRSKYSLQRRSQSPRGLRHRSAASRLLRLWVRIPPAAWMSVCCECCVMSGRGLCDELITRPEESY